MSKSYSHLSEASLPQDFDEEEVVQVHPLHLRNDVTFDLSVLLTSVSLHADAASITSSSSSSSTCISVSRHRRIRRGSGEGERRVLLPAVVKRQNLPDILQLLRIWTQIKTSSCGLVSCR